MRGISWLAAKPVSFSRRTLLHGVSKYSWHVVFNLLWTNILKAHMANCYAQRAILCLRDVFEVCGAHIVLMFQLTINKGQPFAFLWSFLAITMHFIYCNSPKMIRNEAFVCVSVQQQDLICCHQVLYMEEQVDYHFRVSNGCKSCYEGLCTWHLERNTHHWLSLLVCFILREISDLSFWQPTCHWPVGLYCSSIHVI